MTSKERPSLEYYSLPKAAAYLSEDSNADIDEATFLQLALEKKIKLSVHFHSECVVLGCRLVSKKDAKWSISASPSISMDSFSLDGSGGTVQYPENHDQYICHEKSYDFAIKRWDKIPDEELKHYSMDPSGSFFDWPDEERILEFDKEEQTLPIGTYGLPLLGNEEFDVRRRLQRLLGNPEATSAKKRGVYVTDSTGKMYQLCDWHEDRVPASSLPDHSEFVLTPSSLQEYVKTGASQNTAAQKPQAEPPSWIPIAREKALEFKRERPKLSWHQIAEKVYKYMEEENITGRGGRVPSPDTILRHALQNLEPPRKT